VGQVGVAQLALPSCSFHKNCTYVNDNELQGAELRVGIKKYESVHSRVWKICVFNIEGGVFQKLGDSHFRDQFCQAREGFFNILGLIDTRIREDDFEFPGYAVYAEPRRIHVAHGGVALLLRRSFEFVAKPRRLTDAPPETVALEVEGHIFGLQSPVVMVLSYVTNLGLNSHRRYIEVHGRSLYCLLSDFLLRLRSTGREVLLLGDLNAWTGAEQGWTGAEPGFSDFVPDIVCRRTDCARPLNTEGRALLRLCRVGELIILNGLSYRGSGGEEISLSPAITRPFDRDSHILSDSSDAGQDGGTVLDYFLASPEVCNRVTSLVVSPQTRFSDHRPVVLEWSGFTARQPQVSSGKPAPDALLGWRFSGMPSEQRDVMEEMQREAAANMGEHPDTWRIQATLLEHGPNAAYRLIHAVIRDAWEKAGASVCITDGRSSLDGLDSCKALPVGSWYDEETAAACREWRAARQRYIRARNPEVKLRLKRVCAVVRHRYRRLKGAKQRTWATEWSRFWCDVRCNHVSVWKVLRRLAGRTSGGSCTCSEPVQRAHFEKVCQYRDVESFDDERARRAQEWMEAFLQDNSGIVPGKGFSIAQVRSAFKRLRECAPGADGLSKRWAQPAMLMLAPEIAAFFSYLYSNGLCPEDWSVGIVVTITKKGGSASVMESQRGIHLLHLFRQWYSWCLMVEVEKLCARVVPIEQQGFVSGGRIHAAFMALYAVIEQARLKQERLYVAFVDVKKAFPSVRRDILFQKMSQLGASDSLVRAVFAMYSQACGSIRGPEGFGSLYDILIGTREGGVESPLLFVLFVADLVEHLDNTNLEGAPVLLGDRAIRAFQLADDLALIARNPNDIQKLVDRWEVYCDSNHQETQVKKTEIVIFTFSEDIRCRAEGGVLRLPCGRRLYREIDFSYKGLKINVVNSFTYLGIIFERVQTAIVAWESRHDSGIKALGALRCSLRIAPFLPFYRTVEVGESTVGGASLYGAELSAPFRRDVSSELGDSFSAWLLGLGGIRPARRVGWVEFRDLDLLASSRALRVLCEAKREGGLLALAVCQLFRNWDSAGRRDRGNTWMGGLLRIGRRAWPGFRIICSDGSTVEWGAVQCLEENESLSVRFMQDCNAQRWRQRQLAVLQNRPAVTQQDYTLYHIILKREGLDHDFSLPLLVELSTKPIFVARPYIGTYTFRRFLRFLCGVEDFARVNAHYTRREAHPILTREDCKRACLSCLVRRGCIVLDSEWHSLFECPLTEAPRKLFSHRFPFDSVPVTDPFRSYILLVVSASCNSKLIDEFAIWVGGVLAIRRREFRALLPGNPRLAGALTL
jgi:exonuclease III